MEMDRKTQYLVAGGIGVIIIIVLLTRSKAIKKRNAQEIAQIQQHLEDGTGGIGNNSVQNNLHNIIPDYYTGVLDDARNIYNARAYWLGYFFDKDSVVLDTLRNKTKSQIAALRQKFQEKYDKSFDDFLDFLSDENYDLAMDIIQNAP
ncbi:hypothetical protein [uncultured Microscilla sp.]|uniref:hypothetical protein n=1 Tax=uncultured Microscilla sp. TaxID=432653 RepID=UPI002604A319|nr:hypothetical protein [uncultured Microscilla sp.]